MPRDVLLLEEMIEAANRAVALTEGVDVAELAADRMRGTPCSGTSRCTAKPRPNCRRS
jgi:uncharacterized protein with HEPN domain